MLGFKAYSDKTGKQQLLEMFEEKYALELKPEKELTDEERTNFEKEWSNPVERREQKAFGRGILKVAVEDAGVSLEVTGRSFFASDTYTKKSKISRMACVKLLLKNEDGKLTGCILDLGNAAEMELVNSSGVTLPFGLQCPDKSMSKPLYGLTSVKFKDGTNCALGEATVAPDSSSKRYAERFIKDATAIVKNTMSPGGEGEAEYPEIACRAQEALMSLSPVSHDTCLFYSNYERLAEQRSGNQRNTIKADDSSCTIL